MRLGSSTKTLVFAMSYSKIQILPDGNLFVQTGEELKHTEFLAHTSIADFLKSYDYGVVQVFAYDSGLNKTLERNKEIIQYFNNPINRRYYIIYSLNYPDRCWKVWDTDISKLYKIVCGDGESAIFERIPFHSNYYRYRIADDILFHQQEQRELRDIKLKNIIDSN